jgi:hypothetical protein
MPYVDEACPYCGAREGERHHRPECNRAIAAAINGLGLDDPEIGHSYPESLDDYEAFGPVFP